MAGPILSADVVELTQSRSQNRAANYRERASQLRAMAETEGVGRVRDKLLDLADQYEGLAATVADPLASNRN